MRAGMQRGEEKDGAVQELVMSTHDQTNVQPTISNSSSDDAGERLGKVSQMRRNNCWFGLSRSDLVGPVFGLMMGWI